MSTQTLCTDREISNCHMELRHRPTPLDFLNPLLTFAVVRTSKLMHDRLSVHILAAGIIVIFSSLGGYFSVCSMLCHSYMKVLTPIKRHIVTFKKLEQSFKRTEHLITHLHGIYSTIVRYKDHQTINGSSSVTPPNL